MILYVSGDATEPSGSGQKIIAHIVNDLPGWGRGFVVALSQRWPNTRQTYLNWKSRDDVFVTGPFALGQVMFHRVSDTITIANMCAQHGVSGPAPLVRYDALKECLDLVMVKALVDSASIHMPRIGCGLGGGTWDKVEPLIGRCLEGLDVTVYDLEHDGFKAIVQQRETYAEEAWKALK